MTAGGSSELAGRYEAAFHRFVSRRGEEGLTAAYELGRTALSRRVSLLDLVQVHHTALLHELRPAPTEERLVDVAGAASAFLLEVLAAFELAHRP